jgi:hypothetical protein
MDEELKDFAGRLARVKRYMKSSKKVLVEVEGFPARYVSCAQVGKITFYPTAGMVMIGGYLIDEKYITTELAGA